MKKRAVLSVLPLPLPKNEPNAAISGSLRQDVRDVALQPLHLGRRNVLRGLQMPVIRPVSCVGKKPFGMMTNSDRGQRHGREERHQRDEAVPQHDIERRACNRSTSRSNPRSMAR